MAQAEAEKIVEERIQKQVTDFKNLSVHEMLEHVMSQFGSASGLNELWSGVTEAEQQEYLNNLNIRFNFNTEVITISSDGEEPTFYWEYDQLKGTITERVRDHGVHTAGTEPVVPPAIEPTPVP